MPIARGFLDPGRCGGERTECLWSPGRGTDIAPGRVLQAAAKSLKHRPLVRVAALASIRHMRPVGAGDLHKLRDTIVRLLREPDESVCAECVAAALGQAVGAVMMTILGLHDRIISFEGVCSTCHRYARVIRRDVRGSPADSASELPRGN